MTLQVREKKLQVHHKKGSNQIAVRSYNERLVLHLMREHGTLTKAELTRLTGLSANASSVIFRSLEDEALIARGQAIRGRIGQPSTPFRINPDARYYVCLRIGRRSIELAVVDFDGNIKAAARKTLQFPTPQGTVDFVKSELSGVLRSAKKSKKSIHGMAVAMPFELWSWTEDFGAPTDRMDAWRTFDVAEQIGRLVPWEVVIENDATAACRAEVVFGSHLNKHDWVYLYVGTFIGGGIVLNGSVFPGRRGNAGGFGPMRVPTQKGGDRLVDHASIIVLERAIAAQGGDPFVLYDQKSDWDQFEPLVEKWIDRAAKNLAHAAVSALSMMDFEAIVIDGAFPENMKHRLVDAVRLELERSDLQGVIMPKLEAGQIGWPARTIGAAAALISAEYLIDQNI